MKKPLAACIFLTCTTSLYERKTKYFNLMPYSSTDNFVSDRNILRTDKKLETFSVKICDGIIKIVRKMESSYKVDKQEPIQNLQMSVNGKTTFWHYKNWSESILLKWSSVRNLNWQISGTRKTRSY